MPRKAKELAPVAIKRLTEPGLHAVGGVAGLTLQVLDTGARSWLLRYSIGPKRRAMGLGGFPDVPLATARELARDARLKVRAGIDPIEEKRAQRSALHAASDKAKTFKECAQAYIAAHEAGWKNAKHRAQWSATLERHAYPVLGGLLVSDIELAHIMKVLEPIWHTTTETAKRLRGRIEQVLDWATVRGYRKGDNPARWNGWLEGQLPAPGKIAKVEPQRALPFIEIGGFMKQLREMPDPGSRALEFAILTAARSGEARKAVWAEIDLEKQVWIVPAERMKAGKEHHVPLSAAAVKLLKALPRIDGENWVFPGRKSGKPLSDGAFKEILKAMGVHEKATPHGFRSTFTDWARACTDYPRDAVEFALAHGLRDKTEASYFRNNLFDKRKLLMADWAKYCAKSESATILQMKPKKARKA